MTLAATFTDYIKFVALLAPLIIIPCTVIFGSLYNSDAKGLFYVLGLIVTMTFGGLLSTAINKHGSAGDEVGPLFIPGYAKACNIIGSSYSGWGTYYTMPCPDALALAYTMSYFLFPMFLNNQINFFVICGMLLIGILNAFFRTQPPMLCVDYIDVIAGWGTGFILGALWFLIIQYLNGADYFKYDTSSSQKCRLDKKSFRCKKTIKAN
tara:strand:+ start:24464 stop:25090 length:627 start_codon:yes stop_codon:yes gene_type:complete